MKKLIKNILFLSLMLFNTTIFVAIAQDDTPTTQNETVVTQDIAQNNEPQTPILNPLESLYTQYKELGTVTVNPESLESTIALLKEDLTKLEQEKPSLYKIFMYHTGIFLSIPTFIISSFFTLAIPYVKAAEENQVKQKLSYLKWWLTASKDRKATAILSPLFASTGLFVYYFFFKKASQLFRSSQKTANNIALNQAILQQLEKELRGISNEKAN